MKKGCFKTALFLGLFTIIFLNFNASAHQNIISTVGIAKAKDGNNIYQLNIGANKPLQYKKIVKNGNSIYFDIKNSSVSPDLEIAYNDTNNVDNVIVKQMRGDKVRIYILGQNAQNTDIIFKNNQNKNPASLKEPNSYEQTGTSEEKQHNWIFFALGMITSLVFIMASIIKILSSRIKQDIIPTVDFNNEKIKQQALYQPFKNKNPYIDKEISKNFKTYRKTKILQNSKMSNPYMQNDSLKKNSLKQKVENIKFISLKNL